MIEWDSLTVAWLSLISGGMTLRVPGGGDGGGGVLPPAHVDCKKCFDFPSGINGVEAPSWNFVVMEGEVS
jgi:hypothetical protein